MYKLQKYTVSLVREPGFRDQVPLCSKFDVKKYTTSLLRDSGTESVCIISLDSSLRPIGCQIFDGDTTQCAVYPKQVFRFLLLSGASSFIMAHNHPGGSKDPSNQDWTITKNLQSVGKSLDMPMVDHLIICENAVVSLRDNPRW